MTTEEIEQLKYQIAEDSKTTPNLEAEEDAIYAMSEGAGWQEMLKKANKEISKLLEPIQKEDIAKVDDLALIGAMAIARSEKIEILRWFINQAESVKKVRRQLDERAKQQGTSQEESKNEA